MIQRYVFTDDTQEEVDRTLSDLGFGEPRIHEPGSLPSRDLRGLNASVFNRGTSTEPTFIRYGRQSSRSYVVFSFQPGSSEGESIFETVCYSLLGAKVLDSLGRELKNVG